MMPAALIFNLAGIIMEPLLHVHNLTVSFNRTPVVRQISFCMERGRILCLVGESGSGKSMTAFSLMRLVPSPGRISSGTIVFEGENLLELSDRDMQKKRGRDIAMIFQEPMTSLNPVLRIGDQIAEPLEYHQGYTHSNALKKAVELMEQVGIPDALRRLNDYPHQFSGGMRQRVMTAMALACSPRLLLADEPTTALDITIQGQILELLKKLAKERNMGVLLITHDLGVVAESADDVAVMYAGELVEQATVTDFFASPLHPYSQGLMTCAPLLDNHLQRRLPSIPGSVPLPSELPQGCAFFSRCQQASPRCQQEQQLISVRPGHSVRCWRASESRA